MSQLKRKILFPTAVYFKDIPDAKQLNKYLFKEIKKWRKADPQGEKKTNSGFGWHSKTDMDKRKEYKPLPLKQGQAIFFASFLRHKVAPVKKGVRKSLVMWFGGPPFK